MITKIYRKYHTPIKMVIDEEGKSYEVYRCEVDGRLVFYTQASLCHHAGHKMRSPVKLGPIEWLYVIFSKSIGQLEKLSHA